MGNIKNDFNKAMTMKTAGGMAIFNPQPPSKAKLGLCKSDDCKNQRRDSSAYCQGCSDKHRKAK